MSNDVGAAELLGAIHPKLQAAKTALLARRAARQRSDYQAAVSSRHQPLKLAYRTVSEERSLLILYCPSCLRGHSVDLVTDVPQRAQNALELELKQMRPWRLECPEAQANKEVV